jgi:hypothetical protein
MSREREQFSLGIKFVVHSMIKSSTLRLKSKLVAHTEVEFQFLDLNMDSVFIRGIKIQTKILFIVGNMVVN